MAEKQVFGCKIEQAPAIIEEDGIQLGMVPDTAEQTVSKTEGTVTIPGINTSGEQNVPIDNNYAENSIRPLQSSVGIDDSAM